MATNQPKTKRDSGGQKAPEGSQRKADAKGAGKSADPPMKSGGGGKRGKR